MPSAPYLQWWDAQSIVGLAIFVLCILYSRYSVFTVIYVVVVWLSCYFSQIIHNFPSFLFMASDSEVGYCAMGLKLNDNIMYGGNSSIMVFGDVFVALRLSMLGYDLVSLSFVCSCCG